MRQKGLSVMVVREEVEFFLSCARADLVEAYRSGDRADHARRWGVALGRWSSAHRLACMVGISVPDFEELEHRALDELHQPIQWAHHVCARCGTKAVAA